MVLRGIDRSVGAERPSALAREPLTATTLAWLAVVPVAGIGIALGGGLGSGLGGGRIFFAVNPHSYQSLPSLATNGPTPEPTQHARYLIALAVPAMFAPGLLRVRAARWRLPPRLLTALVLAAQLVGLAFAARSGYAQRHVWVEFGYPGRTYFPHWGVPAALAFAAVIGFVAGRRAIPAPGPP